MQSWPSGLRNGQLFSVNLGGSTPLPVCCPRSHQASPCMLPWQTCNDLDAGCRAAACSQADPTQCADCKFGFTLNVNTGRVRVAPTTNRLLGPLLPACLRCCRRGAWHYSSTDILFACSTHHAGSRSSSSPPLLHPLSALGSACATGDRRAPHGSLPTEAPVCGHRPCRTEKGTDQHVAHHVWERQGRQRAWGAPLGDVMPSQPKIDKTPSFLNVALFAGGIVAGGCCGIIEPATLSYHAFMAFLSQVDITRIAWHCAATMV